MTNELSQAIEDLERDRAIELVTTRISADEDPLCVLEDCQRGMNNVGDLFQAGDYYLSELLLSAEIFKEAVAILEPHLLESRKEEPLGKIVLATMHGDIHDLGKNIFATLLRVQSFEVHDMGVNVVPKDLVQMVKEVQPDLIGFSSLITTSFDSTKEATDLLAEAGLRDQLKVLVGGGVTTPTFKDYVGADFQTTDATSGVTYCVEAMGGC